MGICRYVNVRSNRARIKDVGAVRKILQGYGTHLDVKVMADADGQTGTLSIYADEDWPDALKVDPSAEAEELDQGEGEKGFVSLLLALAPQFDSTLTVQASNFSRAGEFGSAKKWIVRPGSTELGCTGDHRAR